MPPPPRALFGIIAPIFCPPLNARLTGREDGGPAMFCGERRFRGGGMLSGFKQFIMRGNVVELAVAVVIGGAFGAVVTAFVKDLLTPLIAAVAGKPDFSAIAFTVNGSQFLIGEFLNALVSFLLIATAVYFFLVAPLNALTARLRRGA